MSALRTLVICSRRQEEDLQRHRNARELILPPEIKPMRFGYTKIRLARCHFYCFLPTLILGSLIAGFGVYSFVASFANLPRSEEIQRLAWTSIRRRGIGNEYTPGPWFFGVIALVGGYIVRSSGKVERRQ